MNFYISVLFQRASSEAQIKKNVGNWEGGRESAVRKQKVSGSTYLHEKCLIQPFLGA